MDKDFQDRVDKILEFNDVTTYPALKNIFKFVQTPIPRHDIVPERLTLYRTRAHTNNDDEFFYNETDLSYRKDSPNIALFGRCNEPGQSMFYAASSEEISVAEIFSKEKLENLKDVSYVTTGIWQVTKETRIASLMELDSVGVPNDILLDTTRKMHDYIDNSGMFPQKELLKSFLQYFSEQFTKPFTRENSEYLFSEAYSNAILESIDCIEPDKKAEGITYPTCKGIPEIRNSGLNFVFDKFIIGFGKKIELIGAIRRRLEKAAKKLQKRMVLQLMM